MNNLRKRLELLVVLSGGGLKTNESGDLFLLNGSSAGISVEGLITPDFGPDMIAERDHTQYYEDGGLPIVTPANFASVLDGAILVEPEIISLKNVADYYVENLADGSVALASQPGPNGLTKATRVVMGIGANNGFRMAWVATTAWDKTKITYVTFWTKLISQPTAGTMGYQMRFDTDGAVLDHAESLNLNHGIGVWYKHNIAIDPSVWSAGATYFNEDCRFQPINLAAYGATVDFWGFTMHQESSTPGKIIQHTGNRIQYECVYTVTPPKKTKYIYETVDGIETRLDVIPSLYQMPEGDVSRVAMRPTAQAPTFSKMGNIATNSVLGTMVINVAYPTVDAGDVIFLVINADSGTIHGTNTINIPSSFNVLKTYIYTQKTMALAYRIADGTESGTVQCSLNSGNDYVQGIMHVYKGVRYFDNVYFNTGNFSTGLTASNPYPSTDEYNASIMLYQQTDDRPFTVEVLDQYIKRQTKTSTAGSGSTFISYDHVIPKSGDLDGSVKVNTGTSDWHSAMSVHLSGQEKEHKGTTLPTKVGQSAITMGAATATTVNVALPTSGILPGDLLICTFISSAGTQKIQGITDRGDFTSLRSNNYIYWNVDWSFKVADGTENGTTNAFTINQSGAQVNDRSLSFQVYIIRNAYVNGFSPFFDVNNFSAANNTKLNNFGNSAPTKEVNRTAFWFYAQADNKDMDSVLTENATEIYQLLNNSATRAGFLVAKEDLPNEESVSGTLTVQADNGPYTDVRSCLYIQIKGK